MNRIITPIISLIAFTHLESLAKLTIDEEALKKQLQAKSISDITFQKKINKDVSTPIGIRYFKNKDNAPSCALIINKTPINIIELSSPEPGSDLPACASPIKNPVIFESSSSVFVVFEYSVEDPKNEFTKMFQLLSISSSGANVCRNDDKIDDLAKKYILKNGIKHSYKDAVKQLGCK